jgi:hypothetical protein
VEVRLVLERLADVAGLARRTVLDEGEDVVFGTVPEFAEYGTENVLQCTHERSEKPILV